MIDDQQLLRIQASLFERYGRTDVYHVENVGIVVVGEGRPLTPENVLYAVGFTALGISVYERQGR